MLKISIRGLRGWLVGEATKCFCNGDYYICTVRVCHRLNEMVIIVIVIISGIVIFVESQSRVEE